MNTMYAAVARRTKEIGTLRVLGFSRRSVLIAFLLESVSIALIGAAIRNSPGPAAEFCIYRNVELGDIQRDCFNFRVTPDLMISALIFGAIIGFVGSLLPSIRASRFKIVDALRA